MSTINNTPVSQDEIKNLMSKPVWQMSGDDWDERAGRLSRLLRKHHLCHQESRDS